MMSDNTQQFRYMSHDFMSNMSHKFGVVIHVVTIDNPIGVVAFVPWIKTIAKQTITGTDVYKRQIYKYGINMIKS